MILKGATVKQRRECLRSIDTLKQDACKQFDGFYVQRQPPTKMNRLVALLSFMGGLIAVARYG